MDNNLEKFFTGKYFKIPNYQRDYAWETSHVDDLIEDILEAIETNTSHYIGTFILSKPDDNDVYNVVDGQQRLTTLIMLFNAVINELETEKEQFINRDKYVQSETGDSRWKLELLNDNNRFFQNMIKGADPEIKTKSQQRLWIAYDKIKSRVKALNQPGSKTPPKQFLGAMGKLEAMEITESNDGKAIRMFQTVNDRGKPLSNMEKAKSLLIYYSNRFLDGELDEFVNNSFGKIFHMFTEIKDIGERNQINVISNRIFDEDSVMRYHFLAYADDNYDYDASVNYVLDNYLKVTLKPLRSEQGKLRNYIKNYVSDLSLFYQSFLQIIRKVELEETYYKLFSVLGVSATLYPLVIRLQTRDLLEKTIKRNPKKSFLDLLEIADVRVYKVRGTNPRADMSYLAKYAKTLSASKIEEKLVDFILRFMDNAEFERRLASNYHSAPIAHVITEYGELLRGKPYSLKELSTFTSTQPTVEHIFAQRARFDFPNFGFKHDEEYQEKIELLGNLTLLEKSINSQCQNKNPHQKINDGFYNKSMFNDAKEIGAMILNRGTPFVKGDIGERTQILTKFCLERWDI